MVDWCFSFPTVATLISTASPLAAAASFFASVPADYDPQAAISDDGSTDFWKKTNAAAEVEDTHEGA